MLFGFGHNPDKKKVKDILRVMDYMDDNKIEYEVAGYLGLNVGGEEFSLTGSPQPLVPTEPTDIQKANDRRVKATDNDPLWRRSSHDCCHQMSQECKCTCHYGAMPLA